QHSLAAATMATLSCWERQEVGHAISGSHQRPSDSPHADHGRHGFTSRGLAAFDMKRLTTFAIVALLVGAMAAPAAAELPKETIPGEPPAGGPPPRTPAARRGRPTPRPQTDSLRPSNPNLPKPEPVAPREIPSGPPSLPGSGRQDVVPGS